MTQRFLPYSPERDVYRLLQVDPRAEPDEIMDAWRRLARTFHPDRNGSQRATEEMQVVNAVRDLLSDPAARAEYDRERHRWMASPVPAERTNRWRTLAGTAQPQPAAELTPVSGPSLGESRLGRTEVSNVQVDRDVSARRTHDGSDREPHRDVHEGRERPSVHQPLQVAMVRASLPSKAHMACRGVLHGDPEPRVEGRRGDAASQILNDRVVIVHPESPCAA